jgi:hypothetical protein
MSYPAAYGYNGDGVDGVKKKITLNKNIPAKRDAPQIPFLLQGKILEIWNPKLNMFRWARKQWRRLWM